MESAGLGMPGALAALVLLAGPLATASAQPRTRAPAAPRPLIEGPVDLALGGGTVLQSPYAEPVEDAAVLVGDGVIRWVGPVREAVIPAEARVVDCSGLFVLAGFWNSHVHFFERKWAGAGAMPAAELERQLQETFARFGFTSVFDTGSPWANTRAIRDRVESGEVAGPRIRSTGEALMARGALPPDLVFDVMGLMKFEAPEVGDESEAASAAVRQLEAGTDAIKIHLQPPRGSGTPLSPASIAAAVGVAHEAGRLAFVHPNTGADVLAALRAGVDVVAHTTPHSGPWDQALREAIRRRRVALTPTLTLWRFFARHDRASARDAVVATATRQLSDWLGAGGDVLFGTDLGAVDADPVEEYTLMAQAGMDSRQVIASLTVVPAERFGEAERLGRIDVGLAGDLVVVEGDPTRDVRALAAVRYTLRDGRLAYARPD